MEALHDAILEALFSGGVLSEEALERLLGEPADGDQEGARQQLEDLIQQIIQRMMERGFITDAPDLDSERVQRRGPAAAGEEAGRSVRGHRQGARLPRLPRAARPARLGGPQQRRAGTTRGISAPASSVAAPKPYEFGDTINIDPSSTILNAVQRLHGEGRLDQGRRRPGRVRRRSTSTTAT